MLGKRLVRARHGEADDALEDEADDELPLRLDPVDREGAEEAARQVEPVSQYPCQYKKRQLEVESLRIDDETPNEDRRQLSGRAGDLVDNDRREQAERIDDKVVDEPAQGDAEKRSPVKIVAAGRSVSFRGHRRKRRALGAHQ